MASGKGAKIAKWTILLLLWCSPHFGSGNPENPRGPGNGFRKRSEYCEMDDFAAFVAFPSFRQLSAAGNPENLKSHGNGFRKRSEHWEMDDFAAFVGFPLISAAFGGRKSRKSKGPWKWLPEKERTLRNVRFCCFCGVPLISAAFGGRKSRKSTGPGNGTPIFLLLVFPSFWQLSAAGNPENPRGLEMGRRFCCFCGVPLISAAFGGRKSRKSKGPRLLARVMDFADDGPTEESPFPDRMLMFSVHDVIRDVLEMVILRVEARRPPQEERQHEEMPAVLPPGPPPPEVRAVKYVGSDSSKDAGRPARLPVRLPNPTFIRVAPTQPAPVVNHEASACKAEVATTRDLEGLLSQLQEPLSITHTASQEEVRAHLEKWRPAIEKELGSLKKQVRVSGFRALGL